MRLQKDKVEGEGQALTLFGFGAGPGPAVGLGPGSGVRLKISLGVRGIFLISCSSGVGLHPQSSDHRVHAANACLPHARR